MPPQSVDAGGEILRLFGKQMTGLAGNAREDGFAPAVDQFDCPGHWPDSRKRTVRPVEFSRQIIEVVEIAQILPEQLQLARPDLEQLRPERRQEFDMVQMMDDRFAGLMKQRHLLALQALAKQAAGFREALPHAFDEQVDVALWQRPRRDAPAHVLDAGKSRFDAPPGLFRADH